MEEFAGRKSIWDIQSGKFITDDSTDLFRSVSVSE